MNEDVAKLADKSELDQSIGSQLMRARELCKFSKEDIASQMCCDLFMIEALEANCFEKLGAPVFVRAHLRRYANLVGAPVEALSAQWALIQSQSFPDLTLLSSPFLRSKTALPRQLLALLGYGALVLFALLWFVQPFGSPSASPSLSEEVPLFAASTTDIASTSVPVISTTENMPVAIAPSVVTLPETNVSVAGAGARPDFVPLSVEVSGDCWVEVTDAIGKRLYYDLLRANVKLALSGLAPLRVLIGRMDIATLSVSNRPVIVPEAAVTGSVAHFIIKKDGTLQAL
ncbi:MAG: DUF4115 domain-containing protein [Gammaproteobacteria bacterium]|nr:DUF4115 domain-containing protein [Gammaproteobacteria bacterium]